MSDDRFFVRLGCLVVVFVMLALGLGGGCVVLRYVRTAAKQADPEVMLRRYEAFKDDAAALDARAAQVRIVEAQIKQRQRSYQGVPRNQWRAADIEEDNLQAQELAGLKASYNQLAARYNANMAKENYRFTNAGDVPPGGQPLPREYRAYLDQ